MNWIKGLGLAVAATCLLGMSVFATGAAPVNDQIVSEGIAITDVKTSNRGEKDAWCTATVRNDSAKEINPLVIVVRYENDILDSAVCETAAIAAGNSAEIKAQLPGDDITDVTKISAFIWDGRDFSIPLHLVEIEKKGSRDTTIASMTFGGVDADIDNENKIITAYVPLYNAEGTAITTSAFDISAAPTAKGSEISVGETLLTGEDGIVSGTVDCSIMPKVVVASEEGNEDEYSINLYRVYTENFDTGIFSGMSSGTEDKKIAGDFSAKGDVANALAVKFGTGSEYPLYHLDNNISIADVSEAKTVDGSAGLANTTEAANNALRIQKKTSVKDKDTGNITFTISPADLDKADTFVLECDIAYDFNIPVVEGRSAEVIQGFCAGLQLGDERWYNRIHLNSSNAKSGKFKSTFYSGKEDNEPDSSITANDSWHHLKAELTKISNDSYSYVISVDGTQIGAKTLSGVKWISYFQFLTSSRRSCNLWIDNINVVYNVK